MKFILLFFLIIINSASTETPDMTPFMDDISPDLYVMFDNETKEERPSSVEDMMNSTRRQFISNVFTSWYHGMYEKIIGCYYIAVTYRSAKRDLRRYFEMRFLYRNNLEFEIGYLVHEIIYKYQIVLELYNMVDRRFSMFQNQNYAPVTYMFYVYTNILMQCKDIIHLCGMLHEVEKKYRGERGVFEDYGELKRGDSSFNSSSIIDNKDAYEKYLQRKRQEEKRKEKERKKYLKQLKKFGITTSRKRSSSKKGSWPLHYGWSIENW